MSRFALGRTVLPFASFAAVLAVLYACGSDSSSGSSTPDTGLSGDDGGDEGAINDETGTPLDGKVETKTIANVAVGADFACRITKAGLVHCWGLDAFGALGDGIGVNRGDGKGEMATVTALDFGAGHTAKIVQSNDAFSCALLDDSSVKCWGAQVPGYGTTIDRGDQPSVEMGASLPAIALGTGHTAKSIAVGGGHACAILDDDSLKCWGANAQGQLGLGDVNARGLQAMQMGDSLPAIALGGVHTAKMVAAGAQHTCALLDDSTVKCWGAGALGQNGLGATIAQGGTAGSTPDKLAIVDLGAHTAKSIAAGGDHTCAVLDDDGVKCWGANGSGQLGQGDTQNRGDGVGAMGGSLAEIALGTGRTAKAIAAGGSHTCAILDDASLKCFGDNARGELGLGDTNARGTAGNQMGDALAKVSLGSGRTAKSIALGHQFTCVALDDGSTKCFGKNDDGELGQDDAKSRGGAANQLGDTLAGIALGAGAVTATVAAGSTHACAVLTNGKVLCWGSGLGGRIAVSIATGDEMGEVSKSLAPIDFGTNRSALQICAGAAFACAHLDDESVKCWGANESGQLGVGDLNARGDDTGEMGDALVAVDLGKGHSARVVTCGAAHACAILEDDSVKCWGANTHGQLGQGDQIARGGATADLGDALVPIKLGTNRTAQFVAASGNGTCALLDDGALKCWGDNALGQLGLEDTVDRGVNVVQMGDALKAVSLGTGVQARALGTGFSATHRCALLTDQTMKCWGDNASSELGTGDTTPHGATVGSMGMALPAVDVGSDMVPQSISLADTLSCEVDLLGALKCFGTDTVGVFGKGAVPIVIADPSAQQTDGGVDYVDLGPGITPQIVGVGRAHACALATDQGVKCWGRNDQGQLGLGDAVSRGAAPNQMGDKLPRLDLPPP